MLSGLEHPSHFELTEARKEIYASCRPSETNAISYITMSNSILSLTSLALFALALSGSPAIAAPASFLKVGNGSIAYEDSGGSGPLVVCVPGMGDVRRQYRFLAPALAGA